MNFAEKFKDEYITFACYTKHPLKYGKNQADNLVTVENSFLRISAQIFSRFLLVFSINSFRIQSKFQYKAAFQQTPLQ